MQKMGCFISRKAKPFVHEDHILACLVKDYLSRLCDQRRCLGDRIVDIFAWLVLHIF